MHYLLPATVTKCQEGSSVTTAFKDDFNSVVFGLLNLQNILFFTIKYLK